MPLMQVDQAAANRDRLAHQYRADTGYIHVGRLAMPRSRKFDRPKCEPPAPAAEGSLHFLKPHLEGARPQMMRWHPSERDWAPMHPGMGKRVGYPSDYLAAVGWEYLGPAPPAA